MKIRVNGAWREPDARDLATLLEELGLREAVVSTALNGEFVAAARRAGTALGEGDQVEVLAPMQGG